MRLRDLPHLVRRFFESLRARRPGPADQQFLAAVLPGEAGRLFHRMLPMDQAHSLAVARRVGLEGGSELLVRAALLHDVGKAEPALGVIGRTVASLLAIFRLPAPGRMRRYLNHAEGGAALLRAAGEKRIVVAFAAGHHSPQPPTGIDPGEWAVLREADAG